MHRSGYRCFFRPKSPPSKAASPPPMPAHMPHPLKRERPLAIAIPSPAGAANLGGGTWKFGARHFTSGTRENPLQHWRHRWRQDFKCPWPPPAAARRRTWKRQKLAAGVAEKFKPLQVGFCLISETLNQTTMQPDRSGVQACYDRHSPRPAANDVMLHPTTRPRNLSATSRRLPMYTFGRY
jgi:hypothetical protein